MACVYSPMLIQGEGNRMSSSQASSVFDQIELGNFLKSACSPEFSDRKAVGLLIRMPERVVLPNGGEGRLPLCIASQLTAAEISGYRHVFQPVNVVLVDDERGETFSGSLWKDRTFRDPPPFDLSPEEMQIVTITNFYNVNILERLDLPRRDAKYHVYVTLNAHKSNVLTVEVKVR